MKMRPQPLLTAVALCLAANLWAQSPLADATPSAGKSADRALGADQANSLTNAVTGEVTVPTRLWPPPSPISLVTNADGTFSFVTNEAMIAKGPTLRPVPELRIHENGATGSYPGAGHTVEVSGNLNSADAVVMNLPGGIQLQGHAIAIGVQDDAGREVLLGQIQDCAGEIDPNHRNVVRWTNAFSGIKADVLLVYGLTYIEQLVVLQENPQLPPEIDQVTAKVFVLSEFWQPPEPRRDRKSVKLRPDPDLERQRGAVQATDETLDWGWMSMRGGRAFAWPKASAGGIVPGVPTAKAWQKSGQRVFIREMIDYLSLKPALDGLAKAGRAQPHELLARSLPSPLPAKSSRRSVRLAKAEQWAAGVVLDWSLQNSALLNVDFVGYGDKTGFAVTGRNASDWWLAYWYPNQTPVPIPSLPWDSNTASPVSLVVDNAPGQWGFATTDLMYDGYVYPWSGGNITLTLTGLPAGYYDFYFYCHGAAANQNSQIQLATAQGGFQGARFTANSPNWQQSGPGNWVENLQYVRFNNIHAGSGDTVSVTIIPDASSYATLNGFQIAAWNQSPTANAGPDQSVVQPYAYLNGTATDDFYPPGHTLALSWSLVAGPGTVNISPQSGTGSPLSSTASFTVPGAYVLRLTADDSQTTGTDDILVTANPPVVPARDTAWVDGSIPSGSTPYVYADTWNWGNSVPVGPSANWSHQSMNVAGLHAHWFQGGNHTMTLNAGDWLFCYVWVPAGQVPREIMLEWHATDGSDWAHRAYWGENLMYPAAPEGDVPCTGRWVRLAVPANDVNLVGATVDGMAFFLYDGMALWDLAGKSTGNGFADTDGDGLRDSDEVYLFHTDPNNPNNVDSNGNGLPDVWENYFFGNMNQSAMGDWSGDGLSNIEALKKAIDPTATLGLQVFTPLK